MTSMGTLDTQSAQSPGQGHGFSDEVRRRRDRPQQCLKKSFPGQVVLVSDGTADELVLAGDGSGHDPVVRVEITQKSAAGNQLIVEQQLTIVAPVNQAQTVIVARKGGGYARRRRASL